jgi:GWxTD domain-containing protein
MVKHFPARAAAVALLLVALPGFAAEPGLVKYKGWNKSPEFTYLATDAEGKDWKKVTTDAEAEKFIAVFWARRNPDLRAAENMYRKRFEKLVELSDKRFTLALGKRGALTERGKLFILVGPPKTLSDEAGTKPHPSGITAGSIAPPGNDPGTTLGEWITTFKYEDRQLPPWAGIKSLVVRFAVEQTRDFILTGDGEARRLETRGVKEALVNPDLKDVPAGDVKIAAATSRPAEVPVAAVSATANEALDAVIAKEPFGAMTVLPLAYRDGAARLMVQVYLEGTPPAEPARFAWLVRGKDGKEAARAEETAGIQKVLKGSLVDRAIPVTPGEYDVAVALLDASGAVAVSGKRSVSVVATPADFAASPIFLAIADLPAEGLKPDAPFVFAGRKFVARGDGRLRKTDGMSFLVRLYNPGVDPATKKAFIKRTLRIQPKGRPAVDLPSPPDEPMALPEAAGSGAVILDLAGTVADNNIGDYFRPGDYTFRVIVEDAVKKTKLEVSEAFTLLAPEK